MQTRTKKLIIGIVILLLIVVLIIVLRRCALNNAAQPGNETISNSAIDNIRDGDQKVIAGATNSDQSEAKGTLKTTKADSFEIELPDSDISKVEIGMGDDSGFDAEAEPEGLAFDTSSGKMTNSSSKSSYSKSQPSEAESTVPAETQPSKPELAEPESTEPESQSETPESTEPESSEPETTESQTGETLPAEGETEDEIETVPVDISVIKNGVQDYDDYEALTSAERKQIRKTFASVKEYNDWLAVLVEKRNDKIREGAIGYGEDVIVD